MVRLELNRNAPRLTNTERQSFTLENGTCPQEDAIKDWLQKVEKAIAATKTQDDTAQIGRWIMRRGI